MRRAPVTESVTVTVYSTSDSAAKKTHRLPFTGVPSRTFTTSSTLVGEKNQKLPVSDVSGTPWPDPDCPLPVFQATSTANLPPWRHNRVADATQSRAGALARVAISGPEPARVAGCSAASCDFAPRGPNASVSATLARLPETLR